MRQLSLAFIAGLIASSAFAGSVRTQDQSPQVERYWSARYVCRFNEDRDGHRVSDKVADAACAERGKLDRFLAAHGYCWSTDEQEWFPVGRDNGFCD